MDGGGKKDRTREERELMMRREVMDSQWKEREREREGKAQDVMLLPEKRRGEMGKQGERRAMRHMYGAGFDKDSYTLFVKYVCSIEVIPPGPLSSSFCRHR